MNEELKPDLVDDEGENQALRSFLMQYSCDRSITVGAMLAHMSRAGWRGTAPVFALEVRPETHLTKAGAQIWIRHLIDLERRTPVSGEAHGCPKDTPYGPAVCGECVDDHAKRAEGERELLILCRKFLEDMHAMPVDWTIRKSSEIHSRIVDWQARGQQAGAGGWETAMREAVAKMAKGYEYGAGYYSEDIFCEGLESAFRLCEINVMED